MTDTQLVEAAKARDADAFAVLVRAELTQTFRMCLLILRSPAEADDATQEAFIRAWRELPNLRHAAAWPSWFRRVAIRVAVDHARRKRALAQLPATVHSTVPDPSVAIGDRDQASALLAALTPEDRALVVLRYYVDLEVPDIARLLGIPLGTAKSRLSRALARMRNQLEANQ